MTWNFYKAHYYLGGVLAAPLLLASFTGLFLGIYEDTRLSKFPYSLAEALPEETPDLDTLLESVSSTLSTIYLPLNKHQTIRVRTVDDKTGSMLWFFHPKQNTLLAKERQDGSDLWETVHRLHRGTWAGSVGKIFMSVAALLMALLWPLGIALRVQKRRNGQIEYNARPAKIHRSLGFFLGGLVSYMAASGALLNFNFKLMEILDPIIVSTQSVSQERVTVQKQMLLANKERAPQRLVSVHLDSKNQTTLFYFRDNSRVYFRKNSPEILKVMSTDSSWIHFLYPLHSARIFQDFRLPYLVGSILLILLITVLGFFSPRKARKRD